MPLKIICGEKKSGKTEFVLSELKKNKKGILIVPEQTLFLYEKMILDKLGEEHSFNVRVLSFKKLASGILRNDKNFNRIKQRNNPTNQANKEHIVLESLSF